MRLSVLLLTLGLLSCNSASSSKGGGSSHEPGDPTDELEESPIVNTPVSTTFLYRADRAGNKIYRASIDLTTGEIAEHEALDLPAGSGPKSLAITPDKKFLYVANMDASTIDTYEVDETTGELSKIHSTASYESPVYKVYMDPQGRYLWALEGDDINARQVSTYRIAINGSLTHTVDASLSELAADIVADPAGENLYVALVSQGVRRYQIDGATGWPNTPGTNQGASVTGLVLSPSGNHIFGSPKLSGDYTFAGEIDGTGDVVSNDYLDADQLSGFSAIAIHPTGNQLYMVSHYPSAIRSYNLTYGASTTMAALNSVSMTSGCAAKGLAQLPTEGYFFVSCAGATGETYSIKVEADGSLTKKHTSVRSGMKVDGILAVSF